jgi:hypothetical protein
MFADLKAAFVAETHRAEGQWLNMVKLCTE